MYKVPRENYQVEDYISDESFINYHFKTNSADQLNWKEWIEQHPDKNSIIAEAIEIIATLSLTLSDKEYQEEFDKITAAINSKKAQPATVKGYGSGKSAVFFQRKRVLKYLIPIVVILIGGGYWLAELSRTPASKLTNTVNNSSMPLILTLSDSTVVTLDPNSYLEYPLHFEGPQRNVFLHGNAKFSVKRDTRYPFKVHAENIVATVLGTVFVIKSSGDSAIVVELLKGKLNVEIMSSNLVAEQSILLDPNERAVYVRNDKHFYKNRIISEHRFHFSKSSFDEIAAQVKDAFGVTLINNSSKKAWSFTGDLRDSTAEDIAENICLVKNLSFVAKGDTIVIK